MIQSSIRHGIVSLLGVMSTEQLGELDNSASASAVSESSRLKDTSRGGGVADLATNVRLEIVLRPFFKKYDRDGNGSLDLHELNALFVDLGENFPMKTLQDCFSRFDTDHSGSSE